jgi:hypothetical protein
MMINEKILNNGMKVEAAIGTFSLMLAWLSTDILWSVSFGICACIAFCCSVFLNEYNRFDRYDRHYKCVKND